MKSAVRLVKARKQIIGICLLLPAFVGLLILILPELPSSPMLRDSFWAHKIDAQPVYDIVYVGDSRVYRGIDPDIIERRTGLKGFNFGFSSAGLDTFLLQRAVRLLKTDGKKMLVIGLSANSFMPESLKNEHLHSLLSWSRSDIWIKKELYSKLNFFDPVSPSEFYKLYKGEKYFEDYHVMSGFAASDKVPLDSTSALAAYKRQFEIQRYSMQAQEEFVDYLSALKGRGISIMIIRMPTSFAMRQLEDKYVGSPMANLFDILEDKGIKCITPSGEFISYDGSHLNKASAVLLSRMVVKKDSTD